MFRQAIYSSCYILLLTYIKPHDCSCTQPCTCGPLDFQEYVETFQAPYGQLLSQFFILNICQPDIYPNFYLHLRQLQLIQLSLLVFSKHTLGKDYLFTLDYDWVKSNNHKPGLWSYRRKWQTAQIMTSLWEWGFKGAPAIFYFLHKLPGCYHYCGLFFFKVIPEQRTEGMA